jgi:HEAT repeat protein
MENFGPSAVYAQILGDEHIKFKGKIIAAELAGKTRTKEAVPALISQLGTEIRDVRKAAAHALGLIGTDEARKALIGLVADPESNVRKMAIHCLGYVPHPDSFDPLIKQLVEEPYKDVIEEIIKTLLKVDPVRLYGRIEQFNAQIREAIGRFASDLEILLKLSKDSETGVKLSAISSLGNLTDKKASERIVEAIHDKDPEVRRTAVIALGSMELGQENLKPLLQDNDMWVRVHAVRSLGNSLRQDMVESIAPMLNDAEIPVVLAAIESMALIGGKDAFSRLNSIIEHENEAVRNAAKEVLEGI